ncbi:MAG: MBOAT family O-acyltransferase [Ruthenibacterium sp.]
MQFTSLSFGVLMVLCFALHWAMPQKIRWVPLLAASLFFYALFGLPMLTVLALCIVGSYCGGIFLAKRQNNRAALAFTLLGALLPLCFFKYFNTVFAAAAPQSSFRLFVPIGISFYTFKIIAYLVEVWRGAIPIQTHFGKYALYLSFFPEVTSGPIQRPADLFAQINAPVVFNGTQALQGTQLILWGLFKKLVIADNLSVYVSTGFGKADFVVGLSVVIAALLYAVQLYCDFSGYSDIAIGCMNLFGYTVPLNFKSPYFALSVKDFWGRWHVSLSSFLRDYVYFPLGGSRCSHTRHCLNLLLTFCISGVWHGTGLHFIVWGLLHGFYQVFGTLTQNFRHRMWKFLRVRETCRFAHFVKIICTFALVCTAWVFFGADNLPAALHLFARMPCDFSVSIQGIKNALVMLGFNGGMIFRMSACILLLGIVDYFAKDCGFSAWLHARHGGFQVVFCYVLLLLLLFITPAVGGGFIYFQF